MGLPAIGRWPGASHSQDTEGAAHGAQLIGTQHPWASRALGCAVSAFGGLERAPRRDPKQKARSSQSVSTIGV